MSKELFTSPFYRSLLGVKVPSVNKYPLLGTLAYMEANKIEDYLEVVFGAKLRRAPRTEELKAIDSFSAIYHDLRLVDIERRLYFIIELVKEFGEVKHLVEGILNELVKAREEVSDAYDVISINALIAGIGMTFSHRKIELDVEGYVFTDRTRSAMLRGLGVACLTSSLDTSQLYCWTMVRAFTNYQG